MSQYSVKGFSFGVVKFLTFCGLRYLSTTSLIFSGVPLIRRPLSATLTTLSRSFSPQVSSSPKQSCISWRIVSSVSVSDSWISESWHSISASTLDSQRSFIYLSDSSERVCTWTFRCVLACAEGVVLVSNFVWFLIFVNDFVIVFNASFVAASFVAA